MRSSLRDCARQSHYCRRRHSHRSLTAGLQPRFPHQRHAGTFPPRILFPPLGSPISQADPKTSLPTLSPCQAAFVKMAMAFHTHHTTSHLPTSLPPALCRQLCRPAGRRPTNVSMLGQHQISAEGWKGEVQGASCGSFKPRPKKKQYFCSGSLPFHARAK